MKCLLDLDGVLVDFVSGALELMESKGYERPRAINWSFVPDDIWPEMDADFWDTLRWTRDGVQILDFVETTFGADNICLLTSPCDTPGCVEGKRRWINRELPTYAKRFLIGPAKTFCAHRDSILIDDYDGNVDAFRRAGGRSVLIPREWNRASGRPLFSAFEDIARIHAPYANVA